MEIIETKIPDVKIFQPKKFSDSRGFFSETYNKKLMANNNINLDFVQDNHSYSKQKYTLRGLHFQTAPYSQDKLVRVLKGSIIDVAVDLRRNSPTYKDYVMEKISYNNFKQILVPKGFAHGILTLEDETEVSYKVTNFYSPENDRGIIWNDSTLNIEWPIDSNQIILSEKDKLHGEFNQTETYFD
mgnify:CR=1 FL=1